MTDEQIKKTITLMGARIDWIMYAVGDCYKALIAMNQLPEDAYEELVHEHNEIITQLRALAEPEPEQRHPRALEVGHDQTEHAEDRAPSKG